MGMNHVAERPARKTTVKGIKARFYPADSALPRTESAYYRANLPRISDRFVLASDLLSNPQLQSYIHDMTVTIRYRRILYKFRVFFKRHKYLPINRSIQSLGGGRMEGDVLLVACGAKVSVRNLKSGLETRVADRAMKRQVSPFCVCASF
ncbi:hypothetical protein BT96DRAFT_1007957 [Gymnopus androsaceus JB14]|uniref:Uncharacterized protein n=1 Tax=Gymnopus androsaceus JB14 TaxID=1447944 RepID=A0A6A4GG32_9AGAR|nr:hypothetical protein BT96DRAFT_1007957 [Gymnopus androsaceus JB14]